MNDIQERAKALLRKYEDQDVLFELSKIKDPREYYYKLGYEHGKKYAAVKNKMDGE